MLKPEKRYDFKHALLQVHKPDRRDFSLTAAENEFIVPNGVNIILPKDSDAVIMTAAKDFVDYLMTSMKLSSILVYEKVTDAPCLTLSLNQDLGDASGYMGYRISVTDDGILVEGYDNKGIAQGLYFLEDLMNLRMAPYLEKKVTARKAIFSPRLIQSPFGMFDFNDECLATMAHLGYDAIDLWIKDLNLDLRNEFIDISLLCERAEKYGIMIYIELYQKHSMHPDNPKAEEFYDNMYGKILRACPKIKGLTILAETAKVEDADVPPTYTENVPNRDPNRVGTLAKSYTKILALVQKVARKINPDIDIIFCTYNWGYTFEKERLDLIENMPEGITLEPAWEMFQNFTIGDVAESVADYSLRFAEPSDYFISEAKLAKKLNKKLYGITNAAGRTWDFGCAPYEPMPYQWIDRYESLIKAHNEWGLQGMRECIHYGFYPSFISDLEKWAFFTHKEDLRDVLKKILCRDFGAENLETVDKAMKLWSRAITHYVPTNEDQYGAYRMGPAYPLWVNDDAPRYPSCGSLPIENYPMFGEGMYRSIYFPDSSGRRSPFSKRLGEEILETEKMMDLLSEGIKELERIKEPNDKTLRLINLGKYLYRNCVTAVNVKRIYMAKQTYLTAQTDEVLAACIDEMEEILLSEKENVEATIPIVQVDSRLGWEPSMEYIGDEKFLRWKLRQLEFELNITLNNYRQALWNTGVETKKSTYAKGKIHTHDYSFTSTRGENKNW